MTDWFNRLAIQFGIILDRSGIVHLILMVLIPFTAQYILEVVVGWWKDDTHIRERSRGIVRVGLMLLYLGIPALKIPRWMLFSYDMFSTDFWFAATRHVLFAVLPSPQSKLADAVDLAAQLYILGIMVNVHFPMAYLAVPFLWGVARIGMVIPFVWPILLEWKDFYTLAFWGIVLLSQLYMVSFFITFHEKKIQKEKQA